MNMEEKFYSAFKLEKECCLVKKSAKELLLLCLQELSKCKHNKIDYSEMESLLFQDEFERRLFHLAGYWGNDLEYALHNKLIELKSESPLAVRDDKGEPMIFTKIYTWLEVEYNYTFKQEG